MFYGQRHDIDVRAYVCLIDFNSYRRTINILLVASHLNKKYICFRILFTYFAWCCCCCYWCVYGYSSAYKRTHRIKLWIWNCSTYYFRTIHWSHREHWNLAPLKIWGHIGNKQKSAMFGITNYHGVMYVHLLKSASLSVQTDRQHTHMLKKWLATHMFNTSHWISSIFYLYLWWMRTVSINLSHLILH